MPTYSYRCAGCSHDFDQYQAFTDDSLTECPACDKAELRKVFNSIGVTFNGSGFYRTDSRSESSVKAEKSAPKKPAADSSPSTPAPVAASSAASTSS